MNTNSTPSNSSIHRTDSPMRVGIDQSGGIFPLLAVILVAVFIVMAFVIDIPSEEVVGKQLQAASDAAALAASSELDGTSAGFIRAKKVAVAVLRQNRIKGASHNLDGNNSFALNTGSIYNADLDGTNYSGTSGTSGNLEISIERGIYWSKEDDSGYEFNSLESVNTGKKYGLPLYLFANAVQVSIKLNNVDTSFAKLFGVDSLGPMTRISKAVNDSEVEREVAPFAIRACDLMLDTDPGRSSTDHFTDSYRGDLQCKRNTIIFREPNWENESTDNVNTTAPYRGVVGVARREGFARYLSHRRPTLYQKGPTTDTCFPDGSSGGNYQNCKNLPIQGVLGITGTTFEKSTSDDIIKALSGSPVVAKLGLSFRSLEDPQPLWNQTIRNGKGQASNDVLAEWINKGTDLVSTALYSGNAPKPQFPWLNTRGPDSNRNLYTRRFWPDPLNKIKIPFIMDEYAASGISAGGCNNSNRWTNPACHTSSQWTNPMCHASGVAVNNLATAKVRKVWVPVLASTERKNNKDLIYCDWTATFSNGAPGSVPVISVSKPRVIGYAQVNVIDGNFANLDLMFPAPDPSLRSTPIATDVTNTKIKVVDGNPAKLEMSSDKIPELKALKDALRDFREQQDDYYDCIEDNGDEGDDCGGAPPSPPDISKLFQDTTWYARCFQFFEGEHKVFGAAGAFATAFRDYADLTSKYLEAKEKCTKDGEVESCTIVYRWDSKAEKEFEKFFGNMDQIVDSGVWAIPDAHCLPVPKPNQYNLNSFDAWETMNPRAAGVGCGGISAVLDQCGSDVNLSTGKSKGSSKPALVN